MFNDTPRTIPFGIRVKLNSCNVVTEAQGRHGTTLDPKEWGDEWVLRTLEANPHFNLVLLDGDESPIFMMDQSLDLVEMLPRCIVCEQEGGYLVVVGKPADRSLRTFCVDCHENLRTAPRPHEADAFATCGHRGEDFHG